MNAEALIGMVLGTCTLQKLIGQGGMGAVYLAQQSRPRRQVAVKVLLPISPSTPTQRAAFLERFRRETDAAAALEHPNIMPVHEYGERDGLAYLVMPYMNGGTLRDELERVGQLPLVKALNYLDQMATALDLAHERGVVHRDIKPANILMSQEGRLVLSDFGLVKILAEDQSGQARLTGVGVPMGTPDYMAPEQVIGSEVDARADLYSLGCILYHMITGTTPFKGEMPMQIAMQHLSSPLPSPRALRPDLPLPAEQVILRVMAKRPADRYRSALDLASAFRMALAVSGVPLGETQQGLPAVQSNNPPDNSVFTPRGLFDPMRQGRMREAATHQSLPGGGQSANQADVNSLRTDIVGKTSMTLPSFTGILPPPVPSSPQLTQLPATPSSSVGNTPLPPTSPYAGKKGLLRSMENPRSAFAGEAVSVPPSAMPANAAGEKSLLGGSLLRASKMVPPTPAGSAENANGSVGAQDASSMAGVEGLRVPLNAPADKSNGQSSVSLAGVGNVPGQDLLTGFNSEQEATNTPGKPKNGLLSRTATGMLADPNKTRVLPNPGANEGSATSALVPVGDGQSTASMMRLTQSMKIVKVPVAGQPGRYLTGLLPVLQKEEQPTPAEEAKRDPELPHEITLGPFRGSVRTVALLVLVVLVVIFSSGIFLLVRSHNRQVDVITNQNVAQRPATLLTADAQASATASANIILSDALSDNNHNWKLSNSSLQQFVFKDGAYHIFNNDTHAATALLPDETLPSSFVYSLTLDEIKGDDTSVNNQFGLVFRYSTRQKGGKSVSTFYFFDIASAKTGGEYQFWKYDDGFGADVNPWTKLWSKGYGKEYHFGHGLNNQNMFEVMVQGSKLTFVVNNKSLGSATDGSLTSGQIGMLVNLKGTEVAFSNLLLTYQ